MTGSSAVARVAPTHPIAVLREQIAPNASDAELAHFAQVCARLDLSPFADQIVLIGRWDKRVGREVHRHQITVAGRRTLAVRTGRLAGIEGPVWSGPRNDAGELVWQEVWDDPDRPPYCARVLVHVHGWTVPANGTAKWDEFAQYDSNGKLLPTWRAMPSHMLGKVAESMALRRAFPDVIDPAVTDEFPVAVDVDEVDLEDLHEATATTEPIRRLEAPAEPRGPNRTPSNTDQRDAHRVIGELPAREQATFMQQWDIDDFGDAWPAVAVADALGFGPES